MNEIWKPVVGYEGYEVSNLGRVRSFKHGRERIMKLTSNGRGYMQLELCRNGEIKHHTVHRLVAQAFIPNPENKRDVNHIDGNKLNNHIENLEWATPHENNLHAYKTGLTPHGEDTYNAAFTNEQVEFIRSNPGNLTGKQLAEMFGVGQTAISSIQRGKTYKNAGGVIRDKIDIRTPDEICKQIRSKYKPGVRGHGSHALAKKFGVSSSTVLRIVREVQTKSGTD